MGYVRRTLASAGFRVDERVYAPLGAGPVLVHEVTIANATRRVRSGSWFEYWAANPYDQGTKRQIGLDSPRARRGAEALTRRAARSGGRPAAAHDLRGGPRRAGDGPSHRRRRFFGAGGAARPAAVAAGRLDPAPRRPSSPAPAGQTMLAFQSGWRAAARPARDPALRVRHRPRRPDRRAGHRSPRGPASLRPLGGGPGRAGCRRSGSGTGAPGSRASCSGRPTCCAPASPTRSARGRRILSPGRLLPVRPRLPGRVPRSAPARAPADLLRAGDRPRRAALLGVRAAARGRAGPLRDDLAVRAHDALANANDIDLWLLWTAAEYVLATRDLSVLDAPVRFADGGRAPLWEHLKRPSSTRSRCSDRTAATSRRRAGDWSDFSTRVPADDRVDARVGAGSPTSTRAPAAARGPARRPRASAPGCAGQAPATCV